MANAHATSGQISTARPRPIKPHSVTTAMAIPPSSAVGCLCHLSCCGLATYPSRRAASRQRGVRASDAAHAAMKMAISLIESPESGHARGGAPLCVDKVYVPEFQH